MQQYINKIYAGLIALLLTIIGFFLSATYSKISETNALVHQLQVELSAMREKENHFMTYSAVAALIDKKIADWHRQK